jgi:GNAT superfamily N-acetyltransferase
MDAATLELIAVDSPEHRAAARELVREYLLWVAGVAQANYGLRFDVETMIDSDIEDPSKFYPPTGRLYLVQHAGHNVGVGALKRLAEGLGEVQRMYVQPQVRGVGAGRALVERLVQDARALGYRTVRLESLKALDAAHGLYRSVGFVETEPYADNSMAAYQSPESLQAYRSSAVFMQLSLTPEEAVALQGSCHCKAVTWAFKAMPDSATACNCTVCRRYGALWAYDYEGEGISVSGPTGLYVRGKAIEFHFCASCGCVAYWRAQSADAQGRRRIAVNLRLTEPGPVARLPIDHFDGLDTFDDLPRDGRCVGDHWF